MSISQFLLENSKRTFYYDNELHAILDQDRVMLSLPPVRDLEYYNALGQGEGVRWKNTAPKALRILLGQACNYSCTYCMQKDIGNLTEKPESLHVDQFLADLDSTIKYDNLTRIELWGGEPFLYWKDMVKIMDKMDRPGMEFYISTNGSPLIDKHLDYFEQLKGRVTMSISHDGPGQESLRGEDILKRPNRVRVIKRMYDLRPRIQFSFNTVISATNYDLFEINNYFKSFGDANGMSDLRLYYIHATNYDATNSTNSANHVLRGEELHKFDAIMRRYIDLYIDQLLDPTKPRELLYQGIVHGPGALTDYARLLGTQLPVTTHSRCGADSASVLSLDTTGAVRLCPHASEKYNAGHLNNIKGIRVLNIDLDRKKDHCAPCPVKRLCKSSCPIKFPDAVFLQNCAVEKVWYGNIQRGAFRMVFGETAELISVAVGDQTSDDKLSHQLQ
jgi:uncharacterized protein